MTPRLGEVTLLFGDGCMSRRDHIGVSLAIVGPLQLGTTKLATFNGDDEQCHIIRVKMDKQKVHEDNFGKKKIA